MDGKLVQYNQAHMSTCKHTQKYILRHILYIWSLDMYAYVHTQRKKKTEGEHRRKCKGYNFPQSASA